MRALHGLIADWDPDILQAHGGEALKYSAAATRGVRPAIVYRRIGSSPAWGPHNPRRMVYGHLMRRAERIVAVAERVRIETINMFKVPSRRVVTIPNAVDVNRVAARRSRAATRALLNIDGEVPVVLWAGALDFEKDPIAALEVAESALSRFPSAVFVMAGDGPLREEVHSHAGESEFAKRLRMVGSRSDIADLLEASDVLLMSSRTEGMPGIVIEAGMAGVPVVAPNLGGIPEVVVHNSTGLLVPAADRPGLAWALSEILGDPYRRQVMSRAARVWCSKNFDISSIAPKYTELYWECMGAVCRR